MRGAIRTRTETLTRRLVGTDVPQVDGAVVARGSKHVGKVGTPGEVLDAPVDFCCCWGRVEVCM